MLFCIGRQGNTSDQRDGIKSKQTCIKLSRPLYTIRS